METKFEQYIRSQRTQLDVDKPDDDFIWEGIQQQLTPTKKVWFSKSFYWKAAAVIFFVISSGYFIHYQIDAKLFNDTPTLSDVSRELGRKEKSYKVLVNNKMQELNRYKTERTEEFDVFYEEMEFLDALYSEYQTDLAELGDDEKIIKGMLDYYEKKIRVLEKLIMEIEKNKRYESKERQTVL